MCVHEMLEAFADNVIPVVLISNISPVYDVWFENRDDVLDNGHEYLSDYVISFRFDDAGLIIYSCSPLSNKVFVGYDDE